MVEDTNTDQLIDRAIAPVLGYGAGVAIVMGAFEFTGGSLSGNKDKTLDEFERKEQLRKNRRRPIEETLSEIGEGRGTRDALWEHYVHLLTIFKVSTDQATRREGQ